MFGFTRITGYESLEAISYLIYRFVPIPPALQLRRANGAEYANPGQRPGYAFKYLLRSCRAERSIFRNPGRCPGLECGGAFSAGIKTNVVSLDG